MGVAIGRSKCKQIGWAGQLDWVWRVVDQNASRWRQHAALTDMGIKCGVKVHMTGSPAARLKPCSISGRWLRRGYVCAEGDGRQAL